MLTQFQERVPLLSYASLNKRLLGAMQEKKYPCVFHLYGSKIIRFIYLLWA